MQYCQGRFCGFESLFTIRYTCIIHIAPHVTLLFFRSSDSNGDGMISDNELRTLVSALNSGQVTRASDVSAVFDFL